MLCRVALVITDVSEELSASIIRATRLGKLGTMLAVTSNCHMLQRNIVTAMQTSNLTYKILACFVLSSLSHMHVKVFWFIVDFEVTGQDLTNFYGYMK
jgi:hypothetical protein